MEMSRWHRLPLPVVVLIALGCTAVEPLSAIPPEHPASTNAVESPADSPPEILISTAEPLAGESAPVSSSSPTHEHGAHDAGAKAQVYTCMMHPEVRLNAPGACPKCGMTLVAATDGTEKR